MPTARDPRRRVRSADHLFHPFPFYTTGPYRLWYEFMNGNNPYAGAPGITEAGHRSPADVPELTVAQKRALRRDVSAIAARTREFLPSEYVVDSDVKQGVGGPEATVAVQPPVGHPVSAGFAPDEDDFESEDLISAEDQREVARGLAASAALQVKQAMQDGVTPTAR